MNSFPWLTALTLIPLLGGVIVIGLSEQKRLARGLTLATSLLSLAVTLFLWKSFNAASGELQFAEQHDWVKSLGIQYRLGVDGLGLLMLLLTAIVTPLALLASGPLFGVPALAGPLARP